MQIEFPDINRIARMRLIYPNGAPFVATVIINHSTERHMAEIYPHEGALGPFKVYAVFVPLMVEEWLD